MTSERRIMIEGIINGISIWKLQKEDESLEQAIVKYAQEDKITLKEAEEVTNIKIERKAA